MHDWEGDAAGWQYLLNLAVLDFRLTKGVGAAVSQEKGLLTVVSNENRKGDHEVDSRDTVWELGDFQKHLHRRGHVPVFALAMSTPFSFDDNILASLIL